MKIRLVPVTKEIRRPVLGLRIRPDQQGYVETVAQCLAEADCDLRWHPVGIFDGETLVGFAMYGFFLREYLPRGRVWLDRLLIDGSCQGKGYGRAAVRLLLEQLEREYPGKDVYLSVIPENQKAARLYQEFGFRFIDEKDIHGEDIMMKKASAR